MSEKISAKLFDFHTWLVDYWHSATRLTTLVQRLTPKTRIWVSLGGELIVAIFLLIIICRRLKFGMATAPAPSRSGPH